MRLFTQNQLTIWSAFVLCLNVGAQNSEQSYNNIKVTDEEIKALELTHQQSGAKTTLANCTDLVNFTGNTIGFYDNVGGQAQASYQYKANGLYMVYPTKNNTSYKGSVLGVVFTAATHNPNTFANFDVLITYLGTTSTTSLFAVGTVLDYETVVINGTTPTDYTVTFANPVNITSTNGFAVGILAQSVADSAKIYEGPNLGTSAPAYGNIRYFPNYLNTYSGTNRVNVYPLLRPIITTTVAPQWLTAKTSTGCEVPAVFNFTSTATVLTPSYITNNIISPLTVPSRVLDYGDGSATTTFANGVVRTHSYTSFGTYTAKYTETYVGWTQDCIASKDLTVVVNNPLPSFQYTTNGLVVTIDNTSDPNMNGFVWNFGDLSTSTQDEPGSHTFSSPGTYVVEVEANAPCGKVRYSVSITVPSNMSTGINKNIALSSQISLFPSPAGNTLRITNGTNEKLSQEIEIYNMIGQMVKSLSADLTNEALIDVSDLPGGIYTVKLLNERGHLVKSFVKE